LPVGAEVTIEFEITFDQLINWNGSDSGANKNNVHFQVLDGTYQHNVMFHRDQIRYFQQPNTRTKFADSAITLGTWYTYRFLADGASMTIYRDSVLLGTVNDCDQTGADPQWVYFAIENNPVNPAETEVHIRNVRWITGLYPP